MPDKEYLLQMQSLPLEAKVIKTELRIREWYDHYNGNVYVSFSGGKDSTVLAHIVNDLYPGVPLVFSNTGLEYPEIQNFAKKMGAEFVRPKMRFDEVISKYGYPIISKEVSDAIYYARRIRTSGRWQDLKSGKRNQLTGGEWENWNPKKIWVPSKEGLGMKKVFDDCNEIYGKNFIRYE